MEELVIRAEQDKVLKIQSMDGFAIVIHKERVVCKIFYDFAFFDFDEKIKDCAELAENIERVIDKPLYLLPTALFDYEADIFYQEDIVQDCWINYADFLKGIAMSGSRRHLEMLKKLCESYFKFYSSGKYKSPYQSGRHLSSYNYAEIEEACKRVRLDRHKEAYASYLPYWKSGSGASGLRNKTGIEHLRYNVSAGMVESTNGMLILKDELVRCCNEIKSGASSAIIKGVAKDMELNGEYVTVEFPVLLNEEGNYLINCSVVNKNEVEEVLNSVIL